MDGEVRSGFDIPKPNCCNFYSKINYKGEKSTVCYNLENGQSGFDNPFAGAGINSLDCGSKTFTNIGYYGGPYPAISGINQILFRGTVGRLTLPGLSDAKFPKRARAQVGHYSMQKMPGIMLFSDIGCKTIPQRYFYDPEDGGASFYNYEDMLR